MPRVYKEFRLESNDLGFISTGVNNVGGCIIIKIKKIKKATTKQQKTPDII